MDSIIPLVFGIANLLLFLAGLWILYPCIIVSRRVMEVIECSTRPSPEDDNLFSLAFQGLSTIDTGPEGPPDHTIQKRETLAALVLGGQAKRYLGKPVTVEAIEGMAAHEIDALYARYKAHLGAAITKSLGSSAIKLYAALARRYLPIPPEKHRKLVSDLEEDPIITHAVSGAACDLFRRYGMYLAPLTAAITTVKHCQFTDPTAQVDCTPFYTAAEQDCTPSYNAAALCNDKSDGLKRCAENDRDATKPGRANKSDSHSRRDPPKGASTAK